MNSRGLFPAVLAVSFLAVGLMAATRAIAVGPGEAKPEQIRSGRALFEKNWTRQNPALGSDGLGPLFNGTSCVSCHRQGGVGGSGEARHNALMVAIERLEIRGDVISQDVINAMVSSFHPGFVQSDGSLANVLPVASQGGTDAYDSARRSFLANTGAVFLPEGGQADAREVRLSLMRPILFEHTQGDFSVQVRARLFGRNTTALFGAGLIDQVSDKLILAQSKIQKRHAEISGRPATQRDGEIGKFGWRGNVVSLLRFNDKACAAELGLKTGRRDQPSDPTTPHYRNPTRDIKDHEITAMTTFVASLPAPIRRFPEDETARQSVLRGEAQFKAIGCAVCHVPDMGPAKGIYSDLLLHDMGPSLFDLSHAKPYVKRITPAMTTSLDMEVTPETMARMMGMYYGEASRITTGASLNFETPRRSGNQRSPRIIRSPPAVRGSFTFSAPTGPSRAMEIVDRRSFIVEAIEGGSKHGSQTSRERGANEITVSNHLRIHIERTNFNQEWRTPPLWGVKDSAPYMHDGRAETILEAITMHDGEAKGTRDRFLALPIADRHALIAFMETMVAPIH